MNHQHSDHHEHSDNGHAQGEAHALHEHANEHGHDHTHGRGGGLRGAVAAVFRPHSHDAGDKVDSALAGAGFSLALACDFRIMDEGTTFRQAYTSAGLSIDGGATFMLPRLVGLARALAIAAFDEPIDAGHAASAGLATRIAAAGEAPDDARALARGLQARSLASFAASKRLLRRSAETPLEVQLEHERAGIVACARTAEGAEGISAFTSKRAPDFPAARTRARGPEAPSPAAS